MTGLCILLSMSLLAQQDIYVDTLFQQETQEAYPLSIHQEQVAVSAITSHGKEVWIATPLGVWHTTKGNPRWEAPQPALQDGPAYAILADSAGNIWVGSWKGLYRIESGNLRVLTGTDGPVSVLCSAPEGIYAAGPNGIWLVQQNQVRRLSYPVARSIRAIHSDQRQGLWVATDVGLYHFGPSINEHFVDTSVLVSAYVRGLATDGDGTAWVAGLGGISRLSPTGKGSKITTANGCPSRFLNCISRDAEGNFWAGTEKGLVRFYRNGSRSLLFSRRWLTSDQVTAISFDASGDAWIGTANGVSLIRKNPMTLASKADYFYRVLMERHIREPWIAGQCRLRSPGDVNSWEPEDDDNDGEYTGNYLAMESFRYAVTKTADAREKARKAFHFLLELETITGVPGYFARTFVPAAWKDRVHDPNREYTPQQLADELVKEPRNKPVTTRWHPSADGKWLWKGDASSDEWCGHMMGYFFYYQLAATEAEKVLIRQHVARLVDHLIDHRFNMVDLDGEHTRWSVWSPDLLNRDPEWQPDRSQNSMELLTFLKFAYYLTKQEKYQQHYLQLIREEHYLDNMSKIPGQNPAWFIYFDATLQAYLYPILLHCETDPKLQRFYREHLDQFMQRRAADQNPLINFLYDFARGQKQELRASVDFLKDTPLDLVDWPIDHTAREDVQLVQHPVLDEVQVSPLPPASIRQVVRWDKNPWTARGGNPSVEREPVFWLLPYWMGRYLELIR